MWLQYTSFTQSKRLGFVFGGYISLIYNFILLSLKNSGGMHWTSEKYMKFW